MFEVDYDKTMSFFEVWKRMVGFETTKYSFHDEPQSGKDGEIGILKGPREQKPIDMSNHQLVGVNTTIVLISSVANRCEEDSTQHC